MKLRNKNTGETGYLELEKGDDEKYIGLRVYKNDFMYKRYNSLAELNDEWEDETEPLIKDEKIRKAVRAWAEANGLTEKLRVINEHFDCCKIIGRCDSRNICLEIEFKTTIAHVNKNQFYTIEELCGEEEG